MEEKNTTKEFANIIKERRRELNLSQKDIAEKLFITEQAVSKWERGLSYPDISNLPKLAEILDVSAEELIYGKLNATNKKNDDESLDVVKTLKEYRNKNAKKIAFFIITISSLVAICAVIIINLAIEKRLTWSYYVIGGVVLGFITLIPIFFLKGVKRGCFAILAFSIFSIPYVYLIAYITKTSYWVTTLVLPILFVTAGFAIIILFLATKVIKNKLILSGINLFLFGVVFNFIINKIVNNFLQNTLGYPIQNNFVHTITMISFLFVSALVFLIGIIQKLSKNK